MLINLLLVIALLLFTLDGFGARPFANGISRTSLGLAFATLAALIASGAFAILFRH